MKTLSGIVLLTISLVAQPPHLNAAPADDNKAMIASSKLMALAEAVICLLPGETSVQGQGTGRGFVTDGCSQDFLSLNSQLQDIQKFKKDFDIEVSCRTHMHTYGGQLKPCTRLTLKKSYDVWVDLCDFSDPHIEGECITAVNQLLYCACAHRLNVHSLANLHALGRLLLLTL